MPRRELAVAGAPVVLAGPNGAGKTNILDAISLLSPGRGLRGARLGEHVRKGPVAHGRTRCGRWRRRWRAADTDYEIGTGLTLGGPTAASAVMCGSTASRPRAPPIWATSCR